MCTSLYRRGPIVALSGLHPLWSSWKTSFRKFSHACVCLKFKLPDDGTFLKVSSAFPQTPIRALLGSAEFPPNYGIWDNDILNYRMLSESWSEYLNPFESTSFTKGGRFYRDFQRVRSGLTAFAQKRVGRVWHCSSSAISRHR
jgi:hypothetical protein